MIARSAAEIAVMVGSAVPDSMSGVRIQGVSIDSRTLRPGNLYVPIVGQRFNGHDFAGAAIAQGAAAVLWNRREPNPPSGTPVILVDDTTQALQRLAASYRRQLPVRVIGVTGSNGKTSTKDILAALLGVKYKTHKTAGNLNNHLGVPLTLLALEEDAEYAVVEMGMSDLGEIRFLSSIAKPDMAVITNVTEVHLGDLRTRERIMQAKLEIAEGLQAGDLLVYHGDNDRLRRRIAGMNLPCAVASFGESGGNDYTAEDIRVEKEGVTFRVKGRRYRLPVLGKHQALNALAAIACAERAGLADEEIREGLARVKLTGMRAERIEAGRLTIVNDAYKSNPSSVRGALDLLYTLQPYRRKIAVLGEMAELGEESARLHREIGQALDPLQLDYVFVIGEGARPMMEAARTNFPPGRAVFCSDREELLEGLKLVAADGALILVKGSRKLELERVVEAIRDWAAVTLP